MEKIERKNYSFFMPSDFNDQLEKIKSEDPVMSAMSKSQAIYYIISKVAKLGIDLDKAKELADANK